MQLTEAEQVAAPTMSKLIAGLEAEGYVKRRGDVADARVWLISATAKARQTLFKGRDLRIGALLQLLSECSREEWEQLLQGVLILERSLKPARG